MDIKKTGLFTKYIAHRGLHNIENPENSLGAFQRAVENGYPIELDVRYTDDGSIVVFHDETLSRMAKKDGYISSLSLDEITKMNLFRADGEISEYKIPSLEEVLELVNGQVPILIETKPQFVGSAFEGKIIEILNHYNGEIAVQSFNPYSMEYFKLNAFEIPRGQLSAFFTKNDLKGALKRAILKRLKMNHISQPDFISYQFDALPNKFVTKTKLPVLAWTVRSNTDFERVKPYCDNIIFENFAPEEVEEETDDKK